MLVNFLKTNVKLALAQLPLFAGMTPYLTNTLISLSKTPSSVFTSLTSKHVFAEQVAVLKGHTGLVKGVTWDPVGTYLASQVSVLFHSQMPANTGRNG